ncbi:KilA-N domain-containing protein [Avibacterium paragallinarum]|uniref:KilA-N domain-containing protein n=1 Tax=Avibacterium paragallinarum TaxID=728 RepID=A0ABU7QKB1_AVIPA|nr:KilA-N domain-containing protein [Avibacterium paragallinarum]WAL56600.1 KilA-N domain-containing protein [Avibacterium paragallinarum]WAM59148.1 KilA-N domain-containing protein [Avibacterium paragallinarum]
MSNLTILNTQIRTLDNLYSLNDFHKASGGEKKHQPALFMRLDTTKLLISEINSDLQICRSASRRPDLVFNIIHGGINSGTWVCQELVIAYAAWISAAFHLKVIRAFIAIHKGEVKQQQLALPASTVDERTGLRDAVNVLVAKRKLTHSEVYGFIHQRFNVEKIEQLTAKQILQAIEYVQKLTIGVEIVLPEPANKIALNLDDFYVLAKAVNYLNHSIPEWERLEDLFSDLESHKNYKTAFNLGTASNNLAQTAERIVMKHTSLLQEGSIRNEIENWIFNSPRTELRPTQIVNYPR